jgi:hypothetical protein
MGVTLLVLPSIVAGRLLPIRQSSAGVPLADSASAGEPATGVLMGEVLLNGGPRSSGNSSASHRALHYKVLLSRDGRLVEAAMTSPHGFRVRLRPGDYKVEGRQGLCTALEVQIKRGRTSRVTLECSIR